MMRSLLPVAWLVLAATLITGVTALVWPGTVAARVLGPPSAAGPVEILAFGTSLDDERLLQGDPPRVLYEVPAGATFVLTDIDAVAVGLVVMRKRGFHVEQVAMAEDIGVTGRGQAFRSYVTGVRFEAGDEVVVSPSDSDVEWVALRGRLERSGLD